ncbi:hypothetical protein [Novosphingobium lindaniclasticum]
MARLPKLKYVKFTRSKGKIYAYFDKGRKKSNGEPIRLPLPPYGTVGFYDSYSSFLGARTKRMAIVPTIASVAELYQNSDDFKDRSEGTKKVYRITLKKVLAEFGEFPLEDVTRKKSTTCSMKFQGQLPKTCSWPCWVFFSATPARAT